MDNNLNLKLELLNLRILKLEYPSLYSSCKDAIKEYSDDLDFYEIPEEYKTNFRKHLDKDKGLNNRNVKNWKDIKKIIDIDYISKSENQNDLNTIINSFLDYTDKFTKQIKNTKKITDKELEFILFSVWEGLFLSLEENGNFGDVNEFEYSFNQFLDLLPNQN